MFGCFWLHEERKKGREEKKKNLTCCQISSKITAKRTGGMNALREALKKGDFERPQRPVPFPKVGKIYESKELEFKHDVIYSRGKYSDTKDKKLTILQVEETCHLSAASCVGVKVCKLCSAVYPHSKLKCCKKKEFEIQGEDCPGELSYFTPWKARVCNEVINSNGIQFVFTSLREAAANGWPAFLQPLMIADTTTPTPT